MNALPLLAMSRVATGSSILSPPGRPPVVRLAATSDLHIKGGEDLDAFPGLFDLGGRADLLLIAGDITESGRLVEAAAAAELLACVGLPIVAVLGNHDWRTMRRTEFRRILERAGIEVLDGGATTLQAGSGQVIGIAGTTGSGGGFWPVAGPDAIHTRTMKRLAVRASRECNALETALSALDADFRVAAMHFAPTASTLGDEPLAKYWMLGNSELGAVIDRRRPDLVIHGHAHRGTLRGATPGGVPVLNVGLPVVGRVHVEVVGVPRSDRVSTAGVSPVAARR